MDRMRVFKYTNDDWYGNYKIATEAGEVRKVETRLVQVSLLKLRPFDGSKLEWRVCVWGNDDFGMEQDYIEHTKALTMFHEVISWDFVNVADLKKKGFVHA